jgi:acid phosphatase family membrane protein YuiD
MKFVRALVLLVGSQLVSASVHAQEIPCEPIDITPPRYFLLLKRDATTIVTAPLHWDEKTWKKAGIAVLAVGAIMLADAKVREEMLRHAENSMKELADVAEPFGQEYSLPVLAGFYGAGKLFDNPRAAAVAEDGFASSLIAAGIITPAIKSIAGRRRPSQSERNYAFGENGGSFPSGHATQAFAIATVIAEHYDWRWVDITAYGVAGLVGYARIVHQAHFTSDVLAGAIIGIAVGKAVVRINQEQRRCVKLEPMVTADGGAGLSIRFDLSSLRR